MKILINVVFGVLLVARLANCDSLIDKMINSVDDNSKETQDLMSLLAVGDLDNGTDEEDEMAEPPGDEMIDSWEEQEEEPQARASFLTGTLGRQATKMVGKTRKALAQKLKHMASKFKKVVNKATQRGKDGWEKFKKMVKEPKKTGKKLFKSVMKDVYETGKEEALEYLSAALLEWIEQKIHNELCECFYNKKKATKNKNPIMKRCRCCIKPPGFKRSCVKIVAKVKAKAFDVMISFNGTEFLKTDLVIPKEMKKRSVCSVQRELGHERLEVCAPMPGYLHLISICVAPGNVVVDLDDDDNEIAFGACFQIKIGKFNLSFEKCVQFDLNEKKLSFADLEGEE